MKSQFTSLFEQLWWQNVKLQVAQQSCTLISRQVLIDLGCKSTTLTDLCIDAISAVALFLTDLQLGHTNTLLVQCHLDSVVAQASAVNQVLQSSGSCRMQNILQSVCGRLQISGIQISGTLQVWKNACMFVQCYQSYRLIQTCFFLNLSRVTLRITLLAAGFVIGELSLQTRVTENLTVAATVTQYPVSAT